MNRTMIMGTDDFTKIKEMAYEQGRADAESEWNKDHQLIKAYNDGVEKGRADAIAEREEYWNMQNHKAYEQGQNDLIEKAKIGEYYCWQQCCETEHCGECCRLNNGVIDYFENILFDDLK